MKVIIYLLISSITIGVLTLFKNKEYEYTKLNGFAQGTLYHITYENVPQKNLQAAIDSILKEIDLSLSIYNANSLISKINRSDSLYKLDKYFNDVYNKSAEVYKNTYGLFDITVGPLVDVWGFGPGKSMDVDSAKIDSILQFIGMEKVNVVKDSLYKSDPRIRLDMNAIAQGYAVDVITDYLERQKIKNYLVEIGGEIRAKGKNTKHELWKVGLDKPAETGDVPGKQLQAVVVLKNRSLATSGNYRKFYEKDGTKYTHTINPKTGYTVSSNLLSASIFAKDCMTADAYATACMVMGLKGSIELLANNKNLQGYLIYVNDQGNYQTYFTSGLKKYLME